MSNTHKFYQSNIALAGICQAAALVKRIARTNDFDAQALQASVNSIAITDPEHTEQVFGSLANLKLGYQTILAQLDNQIPDKDVEITRYVANLMAIERKISANKKIMAALGQRIGNIQRQQAQLNLSESQMLANLASIYSDIVSPIGRKIQVAGNPSVLKQADNQNRVRAVLLAGIRAAVLWRQLGGKRRHILFSRQQIIDCAQQTLGQINTSN
ncbi:high frequency lysogenization protein HflD [Paraglaciecola aestuariivivens]